MCNKHHSHTAIFAKRAKLAGLASLGSESIHPSIYQWALQGYLLRGFHIPHSSASERPCGYTLLVCPGVGFGFLSMQQTPHSFHLGQISTVFFSWFAKWLSKPCCNTRTHSCDYCLNSLKAEDGHQLRMCKPRVLGLILSTGYCLPVSFVWSPHGWWPHGFPLTPQKYSIMQKNQKQNNPCFLVWLSLHGAVWWTDGPFPSRAWGRLQISCDPDQHTAFTEDTVND